MEWCVLKVTMVDECCNCQHLFIEKASIAIRHVNKMWWYSIINVDECKEFIFENKISCKLVKKLGVAHRDVKGIYLKTNSWNSGTDGHRFRYGWIFFPSNHP